WTEPCECISGAAARADVNEPLAVRIKTGMNGGSARPESGLEENAGWEAAPELQVLQLWRGERGGQPPENASGRHLRRRGEARASTQGADAPRSLTHSHWPIGGKPAVVVGGLRSPLTFSSNCAARAASFSSESTFAACRSCIRLSTLTAVSMLPVSANFCRI